MHCLVIPFVPSAVLSGQGGAASGLRSLGYWRVVSGQSLLWGQGFFRVQVVTGSAAGWAANSNTLKGNAGAVKNALMQVRLLLGHGLCREAAILPYPDQGPPSYRDELQGAYGVFFWAVPG